MRELAATVTAAGGAAWTLAVPPDAKVDGYQSLSVARTGVEHDGVEGTFAIKAVRPVEFTVTLDAELSASLDPPIVEARGQAHDLSGIALAEAPVAWTVARATPSVLPARLLEDRAFSYARVGRRDRGGHRRRRRVAVSARTRDEPRRPGRHHGAVRAAGRSARPRALRRDGPGAGHLVAGPGRAGRGGSARRRVPRDGQDLAPADGTVPTPAIRLVARTPAGVDVPGIAVTVRLFRGGEDDKNPVVLHTTTGTSPVRLPLPAALEGQEILVIARPDDARLAIMPSRLSGRVTAHTATPAPAAPDTPVLSLDRASYRPGDRARLTITSPVPDATALLTLERGAVLEARVVALSGTTATVDLPVGDSAVAGLQAAVTLVHGRRSPCCDASRNDPGAPPRSPRRSTSSSTRPRRSSQSRSRHRGTRDRAAAPRCGFESRTRRNGPCRARSPCGRWTRGCSR